MRIGSSMSVGLIGLRAFTIRTQAFVSPGLPYFSIIGLPDTSLGEARERVKAATSTVGFRWPQTRVTVNLSPASLPKRGSGHDLAIAIAVMGASGNLPQPENDDTLLLGELNLDGTVLPITGLLPILLHAREEGITRVVMPQENISEAELVHGVEIHGIRHLSEAIHLLGGTCTPHHFEKSPLKTASLGSGTEQLGAPPIGDMNEVLGQDTAKRSLEVAAAGGHHVLMVGPPGAGKTMLASRLPGIMPLLGERQALEIASVRSLCGTLPLYGLSTLPPFEAPHHTASTAALAGGGSGIAQPGAITRAHGGVLFLDEAPEFSSRALQVLREPLETGSITLSRSRSATIYPAEFLLAMAANPCPCGNYWDQAKDCKCSPRERMRYMSRLSGPLLDRIDIQIDVPPVESLSLRQPSAGESSATIRKRVVQARSCARERFSEFGWRCNAQAQGQWLRHNTGTSALSPLSEALRARRLSLRGADRALRLAWTIADLAGRTSPTISDISEGISMRTRR